MSTRAKLIVLAALLGALLGLHYYDKYQAIAEVKDEYVLKSKEVIIRTERATLALEASSRKNSKEKDAKIKSINDKLDAALISLRNRPLRTKYIELAGPKQACTGRELFREDGEFLTREAARADSIVVERDYYYDQYEKARLKIEELKNGKE